MCEIDIFDDIPSTLIDNRDVKARKRHRCAGCGGFIDSGKKYRKMVYIMDGSFYSEKMCRPCALDSDRFAKEHGFGYFYPTGWLEFVSECIDGDGADADPRWIWVKIRADQRRKKAWRQENPLQAQA
jgi:hypothetical protein